MLKNEFMDIKPATNLFHRFKIISKMSFDIEGQKKNNNSDSLADA